MLKRLALVGLLIAVTGCSLFDDKKKDEVRTDPKKLERITREVTLEKIWDVQLGADHEGRETELVAGVSGGRVFAAGVDGGVYAIDAAKGKVIWKVDIREKKRKWIPFLGGADVISGGVGVGADLVVVGVTDGTIVALKQEDGSVAWEVASSSEVLAPPQVDGDLVVVQAIDGKLVALNALDGEQRWSYSMPVPALTLRGTTTPLIEGEYVVTGFANGRFVVLDRASGLPRLDTRVAVSKGKSDLERLVDLDGNMVIEGSNLVAVTYQGNLASFDLVDGKSRWEREMSSTAGLAAGFGNVYVARDNGHLVAVDLENSRDTWLTEALEYRTLSPPFVVGSYVLTGDYDGYLHVVAQSDGRFVGRRRIDRKGIKATAAVDGNRLYIIGNSGRLNALEIRQGG